ncbi:ATP-binding cassette domain-containing protein [Oscillibacter sp.]|uniref:ABC transporter ATP-binding protein n=1 Tax=Oscillibacter sp. TaxID=1945593 RepID=UPI00289B883E|nr:ATP-binding cassette domain-containing protein [Oscillibacter sp.]
MGFSYTEGAERVSRDVSFAIPRGGLIAIVGPSGSEKSTILRLITRFWDVSEGAILIDGKPLSSLSPELLQETASMVLQEVYLFNETIRENIFFGRKDAREEEMIEAAKKAGCHDFIMALPDGYNTMVGEGGSTLSGGEKQRISIARALLKKAPVLLLDEPTASLDTRNEALVQRAISELVKDTTVIMIAHRLKTVQNADQILVLEDGQLKEEGTHQRLLSQEDLYAKLWNMQQKSLNWNFHGKASTPIPGTAR